MQIEVGMKYYELHSMMLLRVLMTGEKVSVGGFSLLHHQAWILPRFRKKKILLIVVTYINKEKYRVGLDFIRKRYIIYNKYCHKIFHVYFMLL